jgi:hypothetical protein
MRLDINNTSLSKYTSRPGRFKHWSHLVSIGARLLKRLVDLVSLDIEVAWFV